MIEKFKTLFFVKSSLISLYLALTIPLPFISIEKLKSTKKLIKLVYLNENEITVFFDKKTLNLKGWEIVDQYNNNINFSLNIISKNDIYKKGTFKIPNIN